MTFYNVISALLFLGSVRALLGAIDAIDWKAIWMASILSIVVFNDMLATSNLVENEKRVKYNNVLMLWDLANFFLLSAAMVVVSPSENAFDLRLPRLGKLLSEWWFWLLIMVYWLSLIGWTYKAGVRRSSSIYLFTFLVPVFALCVVLLLVLHSPESWAMAGRAVTTTYLALYLVVIRPEYDIAFASKPAEEPTREPDLRNDNCSGRAPR